KEHVGEQRLAPFSVRTLLGLRRGLAGSPPPGAGRDVVLLLRSGDDFRNLRAGRSGRDDLPRPGAFPPRRSDPRAANRWVPAAYNWGIVSAFVVLMFPLLWGATSVLDPVRTKT